MSLEKIQPLIWAIFGFVLSYAAYVRGNILIALLGLVIGGYQLYKFRIAIKNTSEKKNNND